MSFFISGLILTLYPLLLFSYEVDWNLKSKYLQFGKTARLVCSGSGCMGEVPRSWYGGKPVRLLCTDKKSANPNKYDRIYTRGGNAIELLIKHLSVTDLDCNYTCYCGFIHSTKFLKVSDSFFYPPNADNIFNSSRKEDNVFIIDVTIPMVYPFPECKQYIVFENKTVRQNLTISSETDTDGIFINLNIKAEVICEKHKSLITTRIVCTLRNEDFDIYSERIDCRYGNGSTNVATVAVVLTFSCLALMTVVLSVLIYKRKIKVLKNWYHENRRGMENLMVH